ncbi:MAG TPA: TraB/GumN family protein [Puia sp.]|nr:TraB/GumN family protein [Puia sp.]
MKKLTLSCFLILTVLLLSAQKYQSTYPSLLWEITGNGMTKPSYLFGTMHVSSKMVFHLSDSFYHAIASCDVVSLEVDPKQWEPEMFRMQQAGAEMQSYYGADTRQFQKENSFRLTDYEEKLKTALKEEPMQVNGLLYRTYQQQADFEENTYLDLYIYQTARKLGKKATGVENYLESEQLMIEATEDAAKEKRVRRSYPDGENMFSIQNKIQNAYRQGDLSLLDSLSKLTSSSAAFDEKFLYRRNEIQARSIDSIIQKESLFVAVGAAHLPGGRGVIELLRKKGYMLRPVLMTDQDAVQREKLDKMSTPVEMKQASSADGFIRCMLPGQWFMRNESQLNESWQYADMENGSYYMLTRVKTHGGISGKSEAQVMKTIDSLLYDNIPGKILQKNRIVRNGYAGYDIVNKNRHGDMQRYTILVTPFEVLIFKMSGSEGYVSGKEADQFFGSIQLKEPTDRWEDYAPSSRGFSVAFPQAPVVSPGRDYNSRLDTWEYEADAPGGDAYMIIRKNIHNYRFLEEDTLDLSLMEESLKGSSMLSKEISRKFNTIEGRACLDMVFGIRAGGVLKAKAVIKGPDYYLLLARSKDNKADLSKFFNSFRLTAYSYGPSVLYTDTALHFSVRTPTTPQIDKDLAFLVRGMSRMESGPGSGERYTANTRTRYAYFKNDSTGEGIEVTVSDLPRFFYQKDSLKFWENEMKWTSLKQTFILQGKEYFKKGDSICGYGYSLLDTNSSRRIRGLVEVKANTCYKVIVLEDGLKGESSFVRDFFSSFEGNIPSDGISLFRSKSDRFFNDYHSKDSLTRKLAHEALGHIVFEGGDMAKINSAIAQLDPKSKTYMEARTRLIQAIGRITDSCCAYPDSMVSGLRQIYEASSDTSAIQNAVLLSLARIKTRSSYALLKDYLIQKPPVFDNATELRELFRHIGDDSSLGRMMFPEILRLAAIEDFKTPVNNLLFSLTDSSAIRKEDYSDHYTSLLFDAQLLLRKQQSRDEKAEAEKEEGESDGDMSRLLLSTAWQNEYVPGNNRVGRNRLIDHAAALMPFYDRPAIQRLFEQLLQSKDLPVRLAALVLMVKNNKPVPDSIAAAIAADDRYRAQLFSLLDKAGKPDLFPVKYRNQEAMSRSLLADSRPYEKSDSIVLVGKKLVSLKNNRGFVFFYKYKPQNQDEWLMGISGLQPADPGMVNSSRLLVSKTGKKFKKDKPELEQFEDKLHQMILSQRKSAQFFFGDRDDLFSISRMN